MTPLRDVRERLRTNPSQWQAFTTEGHCVVIAPPGSGKTELLTAKLAQDFIDRIPSPHGAACITYSHAASGELSRRLRYLGVERRSNLVIGTVHSFAWTQVVRPFAPLVGREDLLQRAVASDTERSYAFEAAREKVFGYEYPYGIQATLDRRRRHIQVDESREDLSGSERDAALAEHYAAELKARNLIDYDDMIRFAVEITRDHAFVRKVLAARFARLFVDEYQDLGPGLHALAWILGRGFVHPLR